MGATTGQTRDHVSIFYRIRPHSLLFSSFFEFPICRFLLTFFCRYPHKIRVFSMADNKLEGGNVQHGSLDQDNCETIFQPEQVPSVSSTNVILQLKSLFADNGLMSNVYDKPVTALTQANGNILKAPNNLQDTVGQYDENSTALEPDDHVKQTAESKNRESDDKILADIIKIFNNNRILDGLESTTVEKDQVKKQEAGSSKVRALISTKNIEY